MPRFPGCELETDVKTRQECATQKMLQYVYGNLKYPKQARKKGIEGRAIIEFVVDKDGSIQHIKVKRGISADIEETCLALVKGMPKWIPGKQDGKPVKVHFNLPIRFKLE